MKTKKCDKKVYDSDCYNCAFLKEMDDTIIRNRLDECTQEFEEHENAIIFILKQLNEQSTKIYKLQHQVSGLQSRKRR